MKIVQTYKRRDMSLVLMCAGGLLVALSLSGCGVKSAPSHPEGSTYPLVYPAENVVTQPVPDARTTSPLRPRAQDNAPRSSSNSEYYNPPPPATEILAK